MATHYIWATYIKKSKFSYKIKTLKIGTLVLYHYIEEQTENKVQVIRRAKMKIPLNCQLYTRSPFFLVVTFLANTNWFWIFCLFWIWFFGVLWLPSPRTRASSRSCGGASSSSSSSNFLGKWFASAMSEVVVTIIEDVIAWGTMLQMHSSGGSTIK